MTLKRFLYILIFCDSNNEIPNIYQQHKSLFSQISMLLIAITKRYEL